MSHLVIMIAVAFISSNSAEGKADLTTSKVSDRSKGTLIVRRPIRDPSADSKEPAYVLVSLFHKGKLVRTRELEKHYVLGLRSDGETAEVKWKNLPCGEYELCFEAKGFSRGVKRICVCHEDEEDLVIHVELDTKEYQLGGDSKPSSKSNK
jgi:hypothetical protein